MIYYIISSLVLATGFAVYKIFKVFTVPSELRHLPRIPIIGLMLAMLKRIPYDEQYQTILKPVLDIYGLALMWNRGQWEILFGNPKQVKEIFTKPEIYLKLNINPENNQRHMLFHQFIGYSNLLNSNNEEWRRHRSFANPAFKKAINTNVLGNCVLELIDKINENESKPVIVNLLFQRLTIDILGRSLFSYDFEAIKKGDSSYYLQLYTDLTFALFDPFYQFFPFFEVIVPSRYKDYYKNKEFRQFLMNVIEEREAEVKNCADGEDLLSSIIKSSLDEKDEEAKMSKEEVLNNLALFFLAGHDTTASTLTTIFYYLAKYPNIQEKARKEVIGLLGTSKDIIIPNNDQLKSLPYLSCVIKESMRIISTVIEVRRKANEITTLSDGLVIPANIQLVLNLWSVHQNEEIFPNPDQFKPERFLEDHNLQNQTSMVFGFGSRMCIGNNFSLAEQKISLAMLLPKYDFKLGPQYSQLKKPIVSCYEFTHPIDLDIEFTPRF